MTGQEFINAATEMLTAQGKIQKPCTEGELLAIVVSVLLPFPRPSSQATDQAQDLEAARKEVAPLTDMLKEME